MSNDQDSMKSGLSAADLLWPDFKVVDDLVFFRWAAPESVSLEAFFDRTEVESDFNHTHVLDRFSHGATNTEGSWWNREHPDFLAACRFGKRWAEAVASKLSRDFPRRSFFVYYTEQDNPIVRFHQQHEGETPWMSVKDSAAEIESGEVIIHCVSRKK